MRLYFILMLIISKSLIGQETPSDSVSNYILFSVKPKYLLFENKKIFYSPDIHLHYKSPQFNKMYHYNPPDISSTPWGIDTRSSSYYTPRLVRDEMNAIMNRPKDQAFLPVLGVAYLAYLMASKYIFIKGKLEISADDVLLCKDQMDIIVALWKKNPQTVDQLYKQKPFQDNYTYIKLEKAIGLLADQNLVKTKKLENDEIQYFPAITKSELEHTLEKGKKDTLLSDTDINNIDSLQIIIRQTSN